MAKVLYKLFLALMLALFIGFGIAVFYTSPKAPDYPVELQNKNSDQLTTAQKAVETDFNIKQSDFQKKFATYSRNVSAVALGFAVILLILSLTVLVKIDIIGDGALFGGLLTLGYGIIRGFMSQEAKYQFAVVTVGLLITLFLGYIKFLKPEKKKL